MSIKIGLEELIDIDRWYRCPQCEEEDRSGKLQFDEARLHLSPPELVFLFKCNKGDHPIHGCGYWREYFIPMEERDH